MPALHREPNTEHWKQHSKSNCLGLCQTSRWHFSTATTTATKLIYKGGGWLLQQARISLHGCQTCRERLWLALQGPLPCSHTGHPWVFRPVVGYLGIVRVPSQGWGHQGHQRGGRGLERSKEGGWDSEHHRGSMALLICKAKTDRNYESDSMQRGQLHISHRTSVMFRMGCAISKKANLLEKQPSPTVQHRLEILFKRNVCVSSRWI